jgi:hypothetical protein
MEHYVFCLLLCWHNKVLEPSISPVVSVERLSELTTANDASATGSPDLSSRLNEVLRMSDSLESDFAVYDDAGVPGVAGDRGTERPSGAPPGPFPPMLPTQQTGASAAMSNRVGAVKISPRGPSNARHGIDNSSVPRSPRLIVSGGDAPAAAAGANYRRHVSPLTGATAAPSPRLRFSSR